MLAFFLFPHQGLLFLLLPLLPLVVGMAVAMVVEAVDVVLAIRCSIHGSTSSEKQSLPFVPDCA